MAKKRIQILNHTEENFIERLDPERIALYLHRLAGRFDRHEPTDPDIKVLFAISQALTDVETRLGFVPEDAEAILVAAARAAKKEST